MRDILLSVARKLFQFHYGTIKIHFAERPTFQHPYFNSTMVRLKYQPRYAEYKSA